MAQLRMTIGALILLVAVINTPSAQGADPRAVFVQELVDAINSKSLDRRKALLHPKSLVCVDESAASFHNMVFNRQIGRGVPADFTWGITPVPPGQPPMFADQFDYPILPTHLLEIDYATGPTSSRTIVLQLVREGDQWHEVTACPKPETIKAARAARETRARQEEKVSTLVAEMAPSLRDAVVTMYHEGRRVDAIRFYARESGEDITTAKDVVEQLAEQP